MKPKRVSDGAPESIIIVAEHDVLARMVLAEYLRECGYHVIEAASEADVLIVLKAKPVSIILLNAQISGEGEGFKLARRIRDAHPGTDLIMTSGVAKSASKAGELCDQGPLEKPYHPQQLVRQIHRLREKRKVPANRR